MLLTMAFVCLTVADDPAAAVQRRYPVTTIRITTASGTFTYYTLPDDTPPELRRAYRMVEIAEREVSLTERLERLKAQYVEHESRLDAAITNRQIFELESFRGGYRPYRGIQGPGYGYPAWYYGDPYYYRPSPLKRNISGVIAASAMPDNAVRAADQLALAQLNLRKTLLDLAAREQAGIAEKQP